MILLTLFSLAGCSTLSVSSDYDNTMDFAAYHAYRWQAPGQDASGKDLLASNPIVGRRVKAAVDRELAARGYVLKQVGPVDFMVSAVATVRQISRLEPDPVSWNVGYYRGRPVWYRSWWGDPWPTVAYYEEGALMLDITDARKKELAWRGVVRGLVEDYGTPDRMQGRIDQAVQQLLSEFPPARK
ncbi:MAG: DUF4136 domain-containing protein [Chlorobiaceae bacterium]|nr:DUF4136 domain-containing protein [Chlorobiaceae bacterium]